MNRRDFVLPALGATALFSASQAFGMLTQQTGNAAANVRGKVEGPAHPPPEIAMLLYPGVNFLDLMAPYAVLARMTHVHLVWKDREPVTVDAGLVVKPTCSFEQCPHDLAAVVVGGGPGLLAVMEDRTCNQFVADCGARAKYVTSVCSGSMILGAAGLLRGYRATSHWAYRDLLPLFGAEPVKERVVVDRNRITGGGVTAGIDFGLALLSILAGETAARATQLAIEYDPHPPFDSGAPEKAGAEITGSVLAQIGSRVDCVRQFAAKRNAERL